MNESFSKRFGTNVSGTSTVAVATGTSWVSVADLLAQQVPVHSSEAVALLAELCAVLLERGVAVIPHASDVLVNDEGKLAIRGWDQGDSDSAALGRLLHGLSNTTPAPASLRLFVSQAIASERYHTVAAFAEALASYEVPGRNKLIQAVHDRWVATRAAAVSSVPSPPLPAPEQKKKSVTPNGGQGRIPRWAIAAVSVAVAFGGATSAWFAAGARPISIPSVSFSVPAPILNALRWLEASMPNDTAAVETEPSDVKRKGAAKPRIVAARVRTTNPVVDPATGTGITETTSTTGSLDAALAGIVPDDVPAASLIVSDTPAPLADAASPALTAASERLDLPDDVASVADSKVYSSAFADVKPPIMLTRQLTPPDTLTHGVEAASTIELLVDESGGVERARLLSRPSPILATMLLSAAKTWKFRPALNDGRPVKYRLLLEVTTTRP
jgi:hypothetical protein